MKIVKITLFLIPLAILLILGFYPHCGIGKKYPKTSARTAMSQLTLACDDYYKAYSFLPLGSTNKTDTSHLTIGTDKVTVMHALLGLDGTPRENLNKKSFFTYKASKDKKSGLHRTETTAELFDPWGNPYHVLLDYDDDKQLKAPFTGEIIKDKKVLIWSPGPDGKSGTPKTNKDNIYSWR